MAWGCHANVVIMKKLALILLCVAFGSTAFADDPAKKIANSVAEPCYTPSGERGYLRVTGKTTTTQTSSSNSGSNTSNSGQHNTGGSMSVTGPKVNYNYSSGTTSNTTGQSSTTTTTTNYQYNCIPSK